MVLPWQRGSESLMESKQMISQLVPSAQVTGRQQGWGGVWRVPATPQSALHFQRYQRRGPGLGRSQSSRSWSCLRCSVNLRPNSFLCTMRDSDSLIAEVHLSSETTLSLFFPHISVNAFKPATWILQLSIHLAATNSLPMDGISVPFMDRELPGHLLDS